MDMTTNKYIPAGHTSQVERGETVFQIQTEYAPRPAPRITTSILQQGRLVHKVEQALDRPIESLEEQRKAENTIKGQHSEILQIIKGGTPKHQPSVKGDPAEPSGKNPLTDKLTAITGVERVFRLDTEGRFVGSRASKEFKRAFGDIFKNLREVIDIFMRSEQLDGVREKGVYEVRRGRLYLVSVGTECYFVKVRSSDMSPDFESAIKAVLDCGP